MPRLLPAHNRQDRRRVPGRTRDALHLGLRFALAPRFADEADRTSTAPSFLFLEPSSGDRSLARRRRQRSSASSCTPPPPSPPEPPPPPEAAAQHGGAASCPSSLWSHSRFSCCSTSAIASPALCGALDVLSPGTKYNKETLSKYVAYTLAQSEEHHSATTMRWRYHNAVANCGKVKLDRTTIHQTPMVN